MFLHYIDGTLIDCFQWLVRQTELLTNITRSHLIKWLITAAAACLGVAYGSLLYISLLEETSGIVVFAGNVVFAFYVVDLIAVQIASCQPVRRALLPAAIVERRLVRAVVTLATMSLTVGNLAALVSFFLMRPDISLLRWVSFAAIAAAPVLVFVLEYLVCTTSLPPGEKERKKQEREMKNMVPQGT